MDKTVDHYEPYLEELKTYNKAKYIKMSEDKQDETVERIAYIYETVGVFPETVFTEYGKECEIKKCIDKEVPSVQDSAVIKFNHGASLCRDVFPNLRLVDCKGSTGNNLMDRFNDPHKLRRAIKFCLTHKNTNSPVTPSGLRDGLYLIGGNVATNFKPMLAKAIYETFLPDGGFILDYSAGFGGRMLGALTSKNKYAYVGLEPNTETAEHLEELGQLIKKVRPKAKYRIYTKGSEEQIWNQPRFDFAFSSPPYFSLEKYCDEETQSYIKYPTLDEWFDGYVIPTINNIYISLKCDRYYAVNIADFKVGKTQINFVDRWKEESIKAGFEYVKNIPMKIQTRRGSGHGDNSEQKEEGIFLFYKRGTTQ